MVCRLQLLLESVILLVLFFSNGCTASAPTDVSGVVVFFVSDIYAELQRLTSAQEVAPDMLETLQMIAITLNGMKEDGE